jgi:hypothetical protein
MSDDSYSSLRDLYSFFGSAGMGALVGKATESAGLGFAFGGLGLLFGGLYAILNSGMDEDARFLIGPVMTVAGIFCAYYGWDNR